MENRFTNGRPKTAVFHANMLFCDLSGYVIVVKFAQDHQVLVDCTHQNPYPGYVPRPIGGLLPQTSDEPPFLNPVSIYPCSSHMCIKMHQNATKMY